MQANLLASQTQFQLTISGLAADNFNVLQFISKQLALSQSYSFNITFCCNAELNPSLLLDKQATLMILSNINPTYMHGLVQQCAYLGKNPDQQEYLYEIILVSPLEKLKERQSNRIFLQKNILEVVQEVLLIAYWPVHTFEFQVTRDYPARDLTVQYNETDLTFIERLLSSEGLFYYFDQQQENNKLLIIDDPQYLPVFIGKQLAYVNESGSHRPYAIIYDFQENNKQQDLSEKKQIFSVKTDCRELQLGQTFTLTNHPIAECNSNYRVVGLHISANQTAGVTSFDAFVPTYEAICFLCRTDQDYRPIKKFKPNYPYLFTANIQSHDRNMPYLNDKGSYYAQFSFDQTHKTTVQASPSLKLLQTHSGERREQGEPVGIHYPLRKDTQTAVGFIHGDLERPLLLGAIHNSENPSTTCDDNKTQNNVRSHSGNELLVDDHTEQPMLRLATKNHDNHIMLHAPEENHAIHFVATQGEFKSYANKNLTIETNANYQQRSNTNHVTQIQKHQHLLSRAGSIQQQSGAQLRLSSHSEFHVQSENIGNIHADSHISLNADHLVVVQNHHGDLRATAQNGNIILQSQNHLCISSAISGEVKIEQREGGLAISSSANIYFTGPRQCLEALEIHVFGVTIPSAN